jgi:protein N-terminal amidase
MKYLNEHSAIHPTTAINAAYPAHKLTPHPNALSPIEQIRILGGEVMITREGTTPGTSPSQVSMSHFSDASPSSPKLYWVPATRMLETPLEKRGWTPGGASDRTDFSDTSWAESRSEVAPAMSRHNYPPSSVQVSSAQQILTGETSRPSLTSKFHLKDNFKNARDFQRENSTEVERPSSPKSRNASRSRGPERSGSASEPDAKLEQLAQKLDEIAQRVDSSQGVRNPQRRRHSSARGSNDGMSVSGNSIPIAACASIWRSSSRLGNQPPMESKSSSHTSHILSQEENSASSARGREKNLPANRSSVRQYHQSSDHVTRQVSRGRQPDAHTPSRQSSRASLHPENRSKIANQIEIENEPSNFRHVEGFTSLSCPIHGGQPHSEIHQNGPQRPSDELHSHHDRSSASLHSRPALLTKLEQTGDEQAPQERPKSSGSRVVHSQKNNLGARASPRTIDAGTPSSFEPKTPKAMTLSFEVNSPQLSDRGLKCAEPKHQPSIPRPKSAVW